MTVERGEPAVGPGPASGSGAGGRVADEVPAVGEPGASSVGRIVGGTVGEAVGEALPRTGSRLPADPVLLLAPEVGAAVGVGGIVGEDGAGDAGAGDGTGDG